MGASRVSAGVRKLFASMSSLLESSGDAFSSRCPQLSSATCLEDCATGTAW